MENDTNRLGRESEQRARAYLEEKGYKILETNWRHAKLEIDLIAQLTNTIIFVEVKFRKNDEYGEPELFVNRKKQNFIIKAANAYIALHDIQYESRFDIVALSEKRNEIIHLEGAFFPTSVKPL
ncbi:MAG: YraN family protein [Bacteroidia bacterium]|jgi:putative endonuclease|nr:YraN family protein [Bacteroidia bacterium]